LSIFIPQQNMTLILVKRGRINSDIQVNRMPQTASSDKIVINGLVS